MTLLNTSTMTEEGAKHKKMQMWLLITRTIPNEVAKHKTMPNEGAKHENLANEAAKHRNNDK